MRGIGYNVESIPCIRILERLPWSSCLVLHSVEGKSLLNHDVDKTVCYIRFPKKKTPWKKIKSRRKNALKKKNRSKYYVALTCASSLRSTPIFVSSSVTSGNSPRTHEGTSHARMRHSQLQPGVPHLTSGPPLELVATDSVKLDSRAPVEKC